MPLRSPERMNDLTAKVVLDDALVVAALEQISGWRRLGQQREAKWFHPFPARMPLAIGIHLISSLTANGAVVADPMVGSGSTLVAARRLSRNAVGIDRDHLAVRIARCASSTFSKEAVNKIGQQVLNRAEKLVGTRKMRLEATRGRLPEEDKVFIRYWFPTQSQRQLFSLAAAIEELPSGIDQDLAWVVFSSLIIAKSAGASYALDIARSRPHKREDKPVIKPFKVWEARFKAAVSRLPFLDQTSSATVSVQHGNACSLPLDASSVDFILTSPPYRNAIDYLRCHKFSLIWMGHRLAELRELRGTMIGSERGLFSLDGLPEVVEDRLTRSNEESRQVALVRRYLSDMGKLLAEIGRVLRPGGLAVLVVGPTMLNARKSDAADIFAELCHAPSLYLVGSASRMLDITRRSLPPPQTARQTNDLHKRMRREIVLALRKKVGAEHARGSVVGRHPSTTSTQ
jgi:DNA modification methylase